MCFRPAGVTKPIECPKCHKKITPMGGVVMKKCPFCKDDWTKYVDAEGKPINQPENTDN